MEQRVAKRSDNLELYLKQVGEIFNISEIIDERQEKPQVINYYLMNKLTYKFGYNWGGFLHCGISYDGTFKKGDVEEDARIVERYIHETHARRVLELGCGLGPNSAFLARRNPEVRFEALDLSNKPLKRIANIPNLRFHCGDYHDLSKFEDKAYDIVFIVEAFCYSKNKLCALREVKKKLQRNGLFIFFDAYETNRVRPFSKSEDIMWKLVTKGMALDKFERINDVEDYMRQEFTILESKDISACVLPSLERQEARSLVYFKHPIFAKIVNKILPLVIMKNLVVVLLLPTTLRRQVSCYYHHVLRNDH
jgi:SAM-dependent methyltransferase